MIVEFAILAAHFKEAGGIAIMGKVEMPHPGHEDHLCHLHNIGFIADNFEEYKKIIENAQYICKGCGRVADSEKRLCAPEKL
jgi:hypothetical protein